MKFVPKVYTFPVVFGLLQTKGKENNQNKESDRNVLTKKERKTSFPQGSYVDGQD